jgi:hypothetical protein
LKFLESFHCSISFEDFEPGVFLKLGLEIVVRSEPVLKQEKEKVEGLEEVAEEGWGDGG